MKFYESHYDEYCNSVEKYNFHEELLNEYKSLPTKIETFGNIILHGPPGVGKYSQMLYILKRYSPFVLKHDEKNTATIEKQSYIYKISDVHYEIDMSLLGCNSKIIWHEIYQQIVDIVLIKANKHGIIVCKNFHSIHNELLDIFNSYIQQYSGINNKIMDSIKITFILITEHLSFIPDNIMNNCRIISVKRPSKEQYSKIRCEKKHFLPLLTPGGRNEGELENILNEINTGNIVNIKEIFSFSTMKNSLDIPIDNFNVICDGIIQEMVKIMNDVNFADISKFRDLIYDILIYNLDTSDCIWYIFTHFVNNDLFDTIKINALMENIYLFLKQHGNNYRAIFHIERVLFAMMTTMK